MLMKRKIVPIAITSLILGLVFNIFIFDHNLGLNLPLFVTLLLGATLLLALEFNHGFKREVLILLPFILFFAATTAIIASGTVLFFDLVLVTYLLLLVVYLATHQRTLRSFKLRDYFGKLPGVVPASLREANVEFRRAFTSDSRANTKSSALPIVRGLLISLPFLIVFLLLLSSADMVFKDLVGGLLNIHINGDLITQLLLIAFVTSLLTGAYALLFMRSPVDDGLDTIKTIRSGLGTTEAAIVLGSIGSLFLLFIAIQFRYFFGGSDRVLSTSFTYADYARHGFFELIAVAVVSLGLLAWLKRSVKATTPRQIAVFKWLSVGLIVEVMIIMLSAHMRLSLYESAYGFTVLRLLSHLFIGWLAVVFVLMLLYIVRREREEQFAFRMFISVLGFFVVLNLINPEAFIARQNLARFHDTGKIDISYLVSLSEDATPALTQLVQDNDSKASKETAAYMYSKQIRSQYKPNGWQEWNVSRQRSERLYRENDAVLTANKGYFMSPDFRSLPTN